MTAPPLASLEKFADLAARFVRAAESGDLPAMDSIMARRRALLRRIGGPPRATDPAGPGDLARRKHLLETILDLDRRAGRLIAAHRDETGRELARLDDGRRGLDGYRAAGASAAKWIDARG